jgi:hypothetical protein
MTPTRADLRRAVRGRPVAIESSITAESTPAIVWGLITDWERQGEWMLEATDFVVTSEQREGVGVEAEASVRMAGITTRDRIRVVGWEPPKRLAIEHRGWVTGMGEIHLTPLGEGRTHVFWREELHPPRSLGVLGTMGLGALRPLIKRVFGRDLRILAGLAAALHRARPGS